MDSALFNFLAIFNEFMLLFMGNMMYLLTDFVPLPETRYFIGEVILILLYFNVAVNLIMLGLEVASRFYAWIRLKLRPYYIKRAREKAK